LESALGFRLSYDRRNDIREPSEGWFASIGQDYAGFGGEARYMRSTVDLRYYSTLADVISGKYIYASRFTGGHLFPLGGYEPLTLNNFFLGAGSLRGFDRSGAGPRRSNGNATGARLYGLLSNELRISSQFLKQIGLTPVLFLDIAMIGNSGSDTREYYAVRGDPVSDQFAPRISAGLSLLWESPLGPLRFDFADVLLKENYDEEQNFHFQIGVSF
jgi:outer membrane protein insertion porin family